MIIIFSILGEYSTDKVLRWLKLQNKKIIRINRDDDTYKFIKISENEIIFQNTLTNEYVNLLDATACWWRRSGLGKKQFSNFYPEELKVKGHDLSVLVNGSNNLLKEELKYLIEHIYTRVYENCKINLGKPFFNMNRLTTLEVAKKTGLKTPLYEVITQLEKTSIKGDLVSKSIDNGVYEVIENKRYYSYTEKLEAKFIEENHAIELFPSLIMKQVKKKSEIRTFFIAGQFYSMIIFSQNNKQTQVDFRKYDSNKPNKNEPYKLPIEIEQKLKKVFEYFNLNCGSVDLIIDENDEYIFLEINPVGQYGMTSEPCNYNLDYLITNYLIHGTLDFN
jgi:ATP-GRASP peptide maturase of grasp-with-spasm system